MDGFADDDGADAGVAEGLEGFDEVFGFFDFEGAFDGVAVLEVDGAGEVVDFAAEGGFPAGGDGVGEKI